jgi:hypothetical protein
MNAFCRGSTRVGVYVLFPIVGALLGFVVPCFVIVIAFGHLSDLNGGNEFALGMLMMLSGSCTSLIGLVLGLFFGRRFLSRIFPVRTRVFAESY